MHCKHVQRKLDAYESDELAPQVRRLVDEHLRSCERCGQALRRLRKLKGVLEAAPGASLPAGFAERVVQKARRRRPAAAVSSHFTLNPLRWWQDNPAGIRVAAAASVAIGLAVGGLLGANTWSKAPQEKPSADPVSIYNLDYLGDAPSGSLAESYLALVSGRNGEDK